MSRFKPMNLEEMKKFAAEEEARLSKLVFVKEGHVIINGGFEYNIELSRCASHKDILGWVLHLSEKTWVTVEMIERFVELAVKTNGLERPGGM